MKIPKISNIFTYMFAFILSVSIAVGLLAAAAYLPQAPVDEHIIESAEQIGREGSEFYVADRSRATRMSNNSESIMLMESATMSSDNILSIFSNPRYVYDSNDTPVEYFVSYAQGEEGGRVSNYSRYWMGFRATLRLLLQKLEYYQIRRYTSTVFFVLLFSAICSVAEKINAKIALLFAFSIVLVRPHVIAVSLQAFTCFCIALTAMLIVPLIYRHPKWEALFFMEIGIVTMYFDFYSTPILTFGMPMIYLYMLRWHNHKENHLKTIGCNAVAWMSGYVFMWISKLLLTTFFTEENALRVGINSFLYRIQMSENLAEDHQYTAFEALYNVALTLMSDNTGIRIFLGGAFLIFITFVLLFICKKRPVRAFLCHYNLLIIAFLPILWFIGASQPTAIHPYFQYRGIAVAFWAGFCYMYLCLHDKADMSRRNNAV